MSGAEETTGTGRAEEKSETWTMAGVMQEAAVWAGAVSVAASVSAGEAQ